MINVKLKLSRRPRVLEKLGAGADLTVKDECE